MSSKSVAVTSEGTESEEEEKAVSKSQCKWDKKINTQSSQIKDLHEKLDGAIAMKTHRFRSCLTQLHCKLHLQMPYKLQASSGLRVSSLVRSVIQLLQLASMEQQTQTRLATIARIRAIVLIIVFACRSIQHCWNSEADQGKG